MAIDVQEATPTAAEYCDLRVVCGLSPMTIEAAEARLPRTLFGVALRDDGRLVGMGRLVGDGIHVQVVDIVVRPDYQRRGLPRTIMEKIMSYVESSIPECAVVSLFADVDWLYPKFGFGSPEKSRGMLFKRRPQREAARFSTCLISVFSI